MRALLPEPTHDPDLAALYARDWIDTGGVRVTFVSSADGAVAVQGLSRGLQTPGDNRVFAALRDLADVVVVGAGTARAESYKPVVPDERRRRVRERFGLARHMPIALVSARLDIDRAGPLFHTDAPTRPIVVTHAASPADKRHELAEVAEVIVAGTDAVDFASARAQLAERGLTRVLCEGGPSLFAQLLEQQVATELCLSLSPLLAGAGAGRITSGEPWDEGVAIPSLSVLDLLEEDHAYFFRYRVSYR